MAEIKAVHSIPVKEFRSGIDHFDEWIKLFEKAIGISYQTATAGATAAAAAAALETAYKQWLPLKLDDKARLVYDGVADGEWAQFKSDLRKALIDPQDEYLWHVRRVTIIWDGVESFRSLGTRIMRAVDTYHTENRANEYFFRFRMALPKDYKKAIDLGCAKGNRTIDNAIDIAERLRVADIDASEDTTITPTTPTAASLPTPKAVSFSGAAMSDDRLKSLELAVQGMSIRLDNVEATKKPDDDPTGRKESARREFFGDRNRRSPSRDDDRRGDRRESYDRGRRDDSRDGRRPRYNSRDRYRAYEDSSYRSRRDCYDKRDSRDRYDNRDRGRDYNRSYYRRDSLDRRDRYRSPSYSRRDDSRDRRYEDRSRADNSRRDGWGRRDSWDRGYNRRDSSQGYDRRNNDRGNPSPKGNNPRPEHRLAEFNDVDWLCAAITEKRERDQNTQEN